MSRSSSTSALRKGYELPPDIPDIFEAAGNDDVESLEIALQYYDVNVTDENLMTPLHHAAGALAFNTAQRLLQEPGVDTLMQDNAGREAAIVGIDLLGVGHPEAMKMRDLIWNTLPQTFDFDPKNP